jgi:hypothetical protein
VLRDGLPYEYAHKQICNQEKKTNTSKHDSTNCIGNALGNEPETSTLGEIIDLTAAIESEKNRSCVIYNEVYCYGTDMTTGVFLFAYVVLRVTVEMLMIPLPGSDTV